MIMQMEILGEGAHFTVLFYKSSHKHTISNTWNFCFKEALLPTLSYAY